MQNAWLYDGKVFEEKDITDDLVGFVYEIENLANGRKYIGKKSFRFSKRKQVKGKKKKIKVASDWMDYYGSSAELLEDVEKFGKENFRRTIIRLCRSKGEASYFEAKEQFSVDAILKKEYYNSWSSVKVRATHLIGLADAEKTKKVPRKIQQG